MEKTKSVCINKDRIKTKDKKKPTSRTSSPRNMVEAMPGFVSIAIDPSRRM